MDDYVLIDNTEELLYKLTDMPKLGGQSVLFNEGLIENRAISPIVRLGSCPFTPNICRFFTGRDPDSDFNTFLSTMMMTS